MNPGEEVSGGLVIAGGDGPELLELANEILDEMACFVQLFVKISLLLAIALGRDHRGLPRRQERLDHTLIGIEGFVGQHGICFHLRQERVGALQIMRLTTGQEERKRVAQRVDREMDFCAQPAFAAPDRLIFAVFFWAPALCWWARTMVLSIMAYSLSASAASISNIFFQTPLLAQRENRVWIFIGSPNRSGRISPGNTCSKAIENGFHEQPVVFGRNPNMPLSSRQIVFNLVPLVVSQGVSSHGQLRIKLTSHESRNQRLGNPLIEDRP